MADAHTETLYHHPSVTVSATQTPEPIITTLTKPLTTSGTILSLAMANQAHVFRLRNLLIYHSSRDSLRLLRVEISSRNNRLAYLLGIPHRYTCRRSNDLSQNVLDEVRVKAKLRRRGKMLQRSSFTGYLTC